MSGNTFGKILKLTTFGESHGPAIGGVIDGFPAGYQVSLEDVQIELNKRRPGQSEYVSQRSEMDELEILSGVFGGKSLGTPIGFLVRNNDFRSKDYDHLKNVYRPSHADYTYDKKYGFRDHRGGGRSSARETIARIVGGAFADIILKENGTEVIAFVEQIGDARIGSDYESLDFDLIEKSPLRCPDKNAERKMMELIENTAKEGDSLGGKIFCVIKSCMHGLGEPVFDKLEAELAKAMMSINAVKGFELGSGFASVSMKGSEHNDVFEEVDGKIITKTNFSGGVQGGISNGMDIYFSTVFKPVATIMQNQESVDNDGNTIILEGKGRHDVTVLPRAVPIVKAMASMVIADMILRNKSAKRD
jgi:chorismate synthase